MVVFDVGMKRAGFTCVCVLALWWAGVAHATSDFEMRGPVGAVAAGGPYKSHVLKAPKRFDLVGMRWRGRLAPTISLRAKKANGHWTHWTRVPADPGDAPDARQPRLTFKITIPQAGRYVVWAQVNLGGTETFVPFPVVVR